MLLPLGFTALILLAAARFLRHKKPGPCGSLKIISACHVAQQASIMVVQVGNKLLLLGVTRDRINMLADVSDQEEQLTEQQRPSGARLFASVLDKITRKEDEHGS
jgi:flagellar biogenesis protein FliO